MIIWRGKGLLVIASVIIAAVITTSFFPLLNLDMTYKTPYRIQGLTTTLLAALLNYLLTKKFISTKVRVFIDEETGERIPIKDGSHLFFIPNRYWTWIIVIIGLLLTFVSSSLLK